MWFQSAHADGGRVVPGLAAVPLCPVLYAQVPLKEYAKKSPVNFFPDQWQMQPGLNAILHTAAVPKPKILYTPLASQIARRRVCVSIGSLAVSIKRRDAGHLRAVFLHLHLPLAPSLLRSVTVSLLNLLSLVLFILATYSRTSPPTAGSVLHPATTWTP